MKDYEALKQLRRVVKNAPAELLHMRAITENAECGTAHCALGWTALDPWFQAHKPKLCEAVSAVSPGRWCGTEPFQEAEKAFGLDPIEADRLFGGQLNMQADPHEVTKGQVLWNIDRALTDQRLGHYPGADVTSGPFYPDEHPVFDGEEEEGWTGVCLVPEHL